MHLRAARIFAVTIFVAVLPAAAQHSSQPDAAAIIRDLDAANQARFDNILSFTDVEHYSVFRGSDQAHPAAEMTMKMTYRKGVGKDYAILSKSGSSLIQPKSRNPGSLRQTTRCILGPASRSQSTVACAWPCPLRPAKRRRT
jgi:hypothetical protein